MMAKGHVASGVMVGAVSSLALPDLGIVGAVPWILAVAGASILPDIDAPGSTVSRMWGPISTGIKIRGTNIVVPGISQAVSKLSGGHRAGTHSILGVVLVAVLFAVLSLHPIGTAIGTAIGTGLVLSIVGVLVPGKQAFEYWPVNLVLSVLAGTGSLMVPGGVTQYLWLAMAVGTLTHILGDMLTVSGCPIWYPLSRRRDRFFRLRAGGKLEPYLTVLFLVVAGVTVTYGYGDGGRELVELLAL